MKLLETKKKRIITLFLLGLLFFLSQTGSAQEFSSTNFTSSNPVIDSGSPSSSSTNFGLGQSLGQTAIGKSTSTSFQVWSGFQYFFLVSANTLTATAGDAQVDLSWTVPSTFLGVSVGDYDVGVGTTSGSYTFENVGNVTSFTKTGLTNGTTYYFIVKAKTASGTFLVFSNEATATPTGTTGTGGGGGTGGSSPPRAGVTISGFAAPNARVNLLRGGVIVSTTVAQGDASFSFALNDLIPGNHLFGLNFIDTEGTLSSTLNFTEQLAAGVTESVDDLFIGPTLRLSHSAIEQGSSLTINGATVPDSVLQIFLDGNGNLLNRENVAGNGLWSAGIDTSNLEFGTHEIQVRAEKASLVSNLSQLLRFQVGEESIPIGPAPGCRGRADLNCDGLVNLVDFSILLFFWQQRSPAHPKVDIDGSGFVDLKDFSIMLFEWTG